MKAHFKSNRMEDMSVQEMKTKANKVTDESLESTRRMLQMVEVSHKTGAATMVELDKQGKQLKDVERNMDEIKENMKTARRDLNELSKCWGCCLCPSDRLESIEDDWRYKPVLGTKQNDKSRQVTAERNKQEVSVRSASGPYIRRITNDAQEEEMEKNLEQVGSIIVGLKEMAKGINNELDIQNQTIDRITDKVEITTHHVDAATKKGKKIIK